MKLKHLSFALVLPLYLLSGCTQKSNPSSPGTPTSFEAINNAQSKSLSRLDPMKIKTGQTVHTVQSQEVISSQQPIKVFDKEWITDVTQVENIESIREITTLKKVSDPAWGEDFIYEFKDVYSLLLADRMQLLDQLGENTYQLQNILDQQVKLFNEQEKSLTGFTFYNLQSQPVTLVPPPLVQEAPNCGGVAGCQIQADLITYDIIFAFSDGSQQKHAVEWYISADVPFLASILRQCAATVVSVDNARVLVRQCVEVVDFSEGE